jgi:xylulokinase
MNLNDISYIIGIDVGTTSIKSILLNSKGNVVASAIKEYTLDSGPNNSCEVHPDIYWSITCQVIDEVLKISNIDPVLVKGVAFSSQGETLIAVDRNGTPLRKAIVWLDNRSVNEAKEIEKKFGNQLIMNITGQPEVVATWPATRILWLKKFEPETFYKAHKYLLVEDYLLFQLTGIFCTEHSLVSSTLYFDIKKKIWWKEMLSFIGITEEQLPEPKPSGSVVGKLTEAAADATGLNTDTIVVTGAYDHPSGAIGAGNIYPGMVTLTIGGSMAMCVTLSKPLSDITLKIPCQCHAVSGLYFLLPYTQTAGIVFKWFKEEFFKIEQILPGKSDTDLYPFMDQLAGAVAPGSDGLLMLPHLMGSGSPEFNQNAKGAFIGISLGTTKGHFVRSILEAIAFTIQHNLIAMKEKGIEINQIQMLGGGARSPLWCQIIADVTGIPVAILNQSENASIGAAILAGIGAGVFEDLKTATKKCSDIQQKYLPDVKNQDTYQELFRRYLLLSKSFEKYWNQN